MSTPAVVQSKFGTITGTISSIGGTLQLQVTLTSAVTAGNAAALEMELRGPSANSFSVSSIVDDKGNSYSAAALYSFSQKASGDYLTSAMTPNLTNGPSIFTITIQGSTTGSFTMRATAYELSGLGASPVTDVSGGQTSSFSSGTHTFNFTTNFSNEIALAGISNSGPTSQTVAAPWTLDTSNGTAGFDTGNAQLASAGAQTLQVTPATSEITAVYITSYAASGPAPTVTSVNGGSAIQEGTTNVPMVGTNFASGMAGAIIQSVNGTAGAGVAQPTTFVSATSATFNLTMEPAGNQLAFTDNVYTHAFQATVGGQSGSGSIAGGLTPPTGNIFETLVSVNPTSAYRITAVPDLAAPDQLEGSGNSSGTAPVPTGLTFNNDATFFFTAGNAPQAFWVRRYSATLFTWSPWALQSIGGASAPRMMLMGCG